jgi:hypothetical protein
MKGPWSNSRHYVGTCLVNIRETTTKWSAYTACILKVSRRQNSIRISRHDSGVSCSNPTTIQTVRPSTSSEFWRLNVQLRQIHLSMRNINSYHNFDAEGAVCLWNVGWYHLRVLHTAVSPRRPHEHNQYSWISDQDLKPGQPECVIGNKYISMAMSVSTEFENLACAYEHTTKTVRTWEALVNIRWLESGRLTWTLGTVSEVLEGSCDNSFNSVRIWQAHVDIPQRMRDSGSLLWACGKECIWQATVNIRLP